MSKKSLLIPGDFPPIVSGIATYFYEIWKTFPPERFVILCPKDPEHEVFDKTSFLHIIRRKIPSEDSIKAKLFKGLLYTFWTFILNFKYKFNIIHCGQVLSSGFTGWLMNRIFNIPYIVYVYGSETFRFGRNPFLLDMIKHILNNAYLIIPNSHFTKNEFVDIGIPEEKFLIVTPGVDTKKFCPTIKDSILIEKHGLKNKIVLLTVARLDERKGHDNVIIALSKLKNQYPNLVYLIVGKGREEAKLKTLCRQLNIEDQVIFIGYVQDNELPKYYNLCDIFILLNRQTADDERLRGDYEGFGIVFLEASSCGKPVIAGNYGGIADAVENGKSGYIIDGTNISDIIETLDILLQNSYLRTELGNYGLKRVHETFDWKFKSNEILPLI